MELLWNLNYRVVTIKVGPGRETFQLYEDLLFRFSDYFRDAFNIKSEEGMDRVLDLNEDVATFRAYIHWLHTRELRLPGMEHVNLRAPKPGWAWQDIERDSADGSYDSNISLSDVEVSDGEDEDFSWLDNDNREEATDSEIDNETNHEEQETPNDTPLVVDFWTATQQNFDEAASALVDFYIFARRYDTRQLRNDLIDALISQCCLGGGAYELLPNFDLITKVFINLPPTTMLARLIISAYAAIWSSKPITGEVAREKRDDLPRPFLTEVFWEIGQRRLDPANKDSATRSTETLDWCRFHEHVGEEEEEACRQMRKDEEAAY
ncbi:hypothetical protein NA57DRAFT_76128 [Rhizodiscina lignyota]|uniref:BTB domain-containing protein n=1 Tax=Rhizodiscina lignyota TaxID=1504668 RepID=A0A9P4IDM1_9PEZI|nr:hypothetical protein NA57DRAFT_76128 [Rhizodiscina lignyota]